MPASQPANFNLQEFTDNGLPLVGGRLYTYFAGTTTFRAAFTDKSGTVPHTYTSDGIGGQYISLNARGELPASLYLASGAYDLTLRRADGSTVWTRTTEVTDPLGTLQASGGSASLGFVQAGPNAVPRNAQAKMRDSINVLDYGAKADGVTDDTAAFSAAFNMAQTTGLSVDVPNGTYKILSAAGFPDFGNGITPVSVRSGAQVKYVGTLVPGVFSSVPCFGHSLGNQYNLIDYNFRYSAPNTAKEDPGAPGVFPFGSATDIVECIPGPSFKGNADAIFAHTIGKTNVNAAIGAINMVTRLEAGFLGDGNGAEIDIDNYAADRKGLGMILTGLGTFQTEAGIKITRGDTASNWYYGMRVEHAKYGVYVDLSAEAAPVAGVFITGMAKDLLQVRPKDDVTPTDAAIYMTNANGSQVKWRVNKNGSTESASYMKATGDVIVDSVNLGVMTGTASGPLPASAVACIAADAGGYGTFNDLIIQPRTGASSIGSLRVFGGGASPTEQWQFQTNNSFRPGVDNTLSLGSAAYRASVVYAGTGAINTSDARAKQQVRTLSTAEHAVAVRLKGLLRAFKFNDAVASKGDANARIHFGVIAQEVKAAFEAEGLVAENYALLCHDTMPEQAEVRNEAGNVTVPHRAAFDRYGIRYDELVVFMLTAL